MANANGALPPEFMRKILSQDAQQAGAGMGAMVGILGVGYKHLRKAGVSRRGAVALLVALLEVVACTALGGDHN